MNQKTALKISLLGFVASLGFALSAHAQQIPQPSSAPASGISSTYTPSSNDNSLSSDSYGLIGQSYTGFEFGYTHTDTLLPRVMHSYGFVANEPVARGFDAGLKYNYSAGGAFGTAVHTQDAALALTGYLPLDGIKPYIEGDAGYAWQHWGYGNNPKSFEYLLGAGAEVRLTQRWAVTPYVERDELTKLHTHEWNYGAKTDIRLTQRWSTLLGAQIDDDHNMDYRLGLNMHF